MRRSVCLIRGKFKRCESGQSIVETALLVPVLLLITFNAVNFAYFFFVAVNLTSAPHLGVEYSIQGFATPSQPSLPPATPPASGPDISVSTLTYQDMVGLNGSASASMQLCSVVLGVQAAGTSKCTKVNPSASITYPTPDADPEPASFVLNRVDVWYTVTPLIPAGLFGLTLTPSSTFHRQVSMRAMN